MTDTTSTPRRARVTYANVTATLALIVALGGTSYAATALPGNSVGTPQLKNNAVTTAKIKPGNVAPSDLSTASRNLARSGPVSPGAVGGAFHDVTGSGPGGANWRRGTISGTTLYNPAPIAEATTLSPDLPMLARSLVVKVINDVPDGGTVRIDLVARATFGDGLEPGVLSCTITGTASPDDRECRAAGPGLVRARQFVFVRSTVTGGSADTNAPGLIWWGLTLEERR